MPEPDLNKPYAGLPIEQYLDLSSLTLATSGGDGEPHAAEVYFAAGEDLSLYFFSLPASQHGADLAVDPRAAVTISLPTGSWEDIQGLQMRGRVEPIPRGAEWDASWRMYLSKFPFVAMLADEVTRNVLYRFRPRWIRLVDNRRGFGYKEEWTLP